MVGPTPPTASSSITSSNGWPLRVMSCSIRTRAASPAGLTGGTRQTSLVSTELVQGAAIRGPGGLQSAFADHLHQERNDAFDVDSGRSGLPHAHGRGRRRDVSGAEVSKDTNGNGALSQRNARAVTLRPTLASDRAPATHRRLVR